MPVFDTIVPQVDPPLADLSILYPVMAEPPLSAGGAPLKLICEEETTVAASPLGGEGATTRGVADGAVEGGAGPPAPFEGGWWLLAVGLDRRVAAEDVAAIP